MTGLCELLSPILAFTVDEAWEFIPGKAGLASVHLTTWNLGALSHSDAKRSVEELKKLVNTLARKVSQDVR